MKIKNEQLNSLKLQTKIINDNKKINNLKKNEINLKNNLLNKNINNDISSAKLIQYESSKKINKPKLLSDRNYP